MKIFHRNFVLTIQLIFFIGLTSCIQTGDEERPGIAVRADMILTKVWEVTLFEDDGKNKTNLFQNVFLEFRPNFVFKITRGCEVINGEWILSNDSTLLVIRIPDAPEPLNQLVDEWVITWLSDTEMHFIEQDDKGDEVFHLKTAPLPVLSCQSCQDQAEILTDSIWSITLLTTGSNDITEQARESYLKFHENGEVILDSNQDEIVGLWAITDQCQILKIKWPEDQVYSSYYQFLDNSWFIQNMDHQNILLESEDSHQLQLTKGRISGCDDLRSQLSNTSWSIDYMAINDDNVSDNFTGTGFTFLENNQLATEVIIGPAVLGGWMLTGTCDRLILEIQAGQLKELSREWVITDVKDNRISLVFEEGTLRMEMHLALGKPGLSNQCIEFIDNIIERNWSVTNFMDNEDSETADLTGYYIRFTEDGGLSIWNDDHQIAGNWYPIKDCQYIVIDVDHKSPVSSMAGKWRIESFKEDKIIMVYEKLNRVKKVELIGE